MNKAIVLVLKKRGKEFHSFTSRNFRKNLEILTGEAPCGAQAHHISPQADDFTDFFKGKIDIHNPAFGTWWETEGHKANAKAWNDAWYAFMDKNPDATADDILKFGKSLAERYGLTVHYK